MNLAASAPVWVAALLVLLLLAAAVQDAVSLRISNLLSGSILLLAIVAAVIAGPRWPLWQNGLILLALLLVGTPLFAKGILGGGDVKLLAVTGAWFNLVGSSLMLAYVFLAGGVLALLILALRYRRWGEAAIRRLPVLKRGAGIPYGIAIAAGTIGAVLAQRS